MNATFQARRPRKRRSRAVTTTIVSLGAVCIVLLGLLVLLMSAVHQQFWAAKGRAPATIELPLASMHREFPRQRFPVAIAADGKMAFAGRPIGSMRELRVLLSKAAGRIPYLMIQADERVDHGTVIDVMKLAKQEGIERLIVAVEGRAFPGGPDGWGWRS